MPQTLEILQCSFQHDWSVGMSLTATEGLSVDDFLMLGINESLLLYPWEWSFRL